MICRFLFLELDKFEFVGISSKLLRIFWKTEGVDYYMIFKASNGAEIIEINKVDELDAYHFGQLFYFFQFACYLSCKIMGVNPFDQPGVEAYKKWMFEALGK